MDPIVSRGRRLLIVWVGLVLAAVVANRLAVVLIAINGRDDLPAQLLSDAIAGAVVLYVAFGGDRVARWLGVLLFAAWGVTSVVAAVGLGGAATMNLRGEVVVLLAVGGWGVVVQAIAVLTGVVVLGFAAVLVGSPSLKRYFAARRGPK